MALPTSRGRYHSPHGGQQQSTSVDNRNREPFCSSSSGSSKDDDYDAKAVIGKDIICKRRYVSPKQVVLLKRVFAMEPFPMSATKSWLSKVLHMSPKRVAVWFNTSGHIRRKVSHCPHSTSSLFASLSLATLASDLSLFPVPSMVD
jgi:hypothetical protein